MKRHSDQEQNDDETLEEESDEVVNERMEEAKSVLEKIEDFRRDSKYGK